MAEPAIETHNAYDPELRTVLVEQLAAPARIWGHGDAPHMPKSYPHYERDLREALDYAGQFLDGYVMARYLEETRHWPADQDLVAILGMAKELLAGIVADLNKPKADGKLFKVGDVFEDTYNIAYRIERIEFDYGRPEDSIYYFMRVDTQREFSVTHKELFNDVQAGRIRKASR